MNVGHVLEWRRKQPWHHRIVPLSLSVRMFTCSPTAAEDMDEDDRRPTQRRRVDRAQAGVVEDEDEDVVSITANLSFVAPWAMGKRQLDEMRVTDHNG